MTASTALVTIHFANQRFDLLVPAEVAMRDLIPLLLMALGPQTGDLPPTSDAAWGLGRMRGTAPLGEAQTLTQAGILDGEELLLQVSAAWSAAREVSTEASLFAQRAAGPWII